MASLEDKLHSVSDVDIDNSGKFKYILIKVCAGSESKCIVRGFDWAEFHADIYDQVASGLSALGLTSECVGGGRILHVPNEKKLFVYGYSMGFGKADHEITVQLLKKSYPTYNNISFSNEGY
eukprot:gene10757-19545_t